MRSPKAAKFPALVALLGVFRVEPALASENACPSLAVDADAGVLDRWPDLPARVRELGNGRDDIDTCAMVALALGDASISVTVTLPDGRAAARSLSRSEDVLPVVEALLLVPRSDPPSAEPAPEPPSAEPVSILTLKTSAPSAALERDRASGLHANSPPRLRVELSVAPGARIGDGQTSIGVGAFSFLELDGWLAGFEGRLDQYQNIEGGSEAAALELAALGGRRLRFASLALDFFAGPALVLLGTTTEVTQAAPDGPVDSKSSSGAVVRWLAGSRLTFGAGSSFRPFVAVDGEFGAQRAPGAELLTSAPRLPAWTVGLAGGATVGVP
jgi:hypothetical protein